MAVDRNLDPREAEALAADYVAGNLSADEAEAFARLLTEQPDLRNIVREIEAGVGLMLGELSLMEPPQQLADSILAAAAMPAERASPEASSPSVAVPRPTGSRAMVRGLGIAAALATLLALALGTNNQRLRLANQQLRQDLTAANQALQAADEALLASNTSQEARMILHQQSARFYDFEGTEAAQTAFGNMVVDTDGLQAAIAFRNLPPNQTYTLWVPRDGDYIYCGTFETDTTGEAFTTLPMPAVYQSRSWIKEVLVTLESQPDSNQIPEQPSGPVVAQTL